MIRRVLVAGGLDPAGGAGLTADARTLCWHDCLALPVALALTVQNRHGLQHIAAVAAGLWQRALAAALADGEVHAVKTGLLAGPEQIEDLARALGPLAGRVPIVVDPVLSATAGGFRDDGALAAAFREHLLPLATVVTPNLPELAALAPDGSAALLARGTGAVLLKGGHDDGATVCDLLLTPQGEHRQVHARLPVGAVHGTGCALAAALAAGLAHGRELPDAAAAAIQFVHDCLSTMGPPDASGLPRPLPLPSRTSRR